MSIKKSDIPELLDRAKAFLVAIERARGAGTVLSKSGPLEIHFYNLATRTKNEIQSYIALLEDANGTYLKDIRSK